MDKQIGTYVDLGDSHSLTVNCKKKDIGIVMDRVQKLEGRPSNYKPCIVKISISDLEYLDVKRISSLEIARNRISLDKKLKNRTISLNDIVKEFGLIIIPSEILNLMKQGYVL